MSRSVDAVPGSDQRADLQELIESHARDIDARRVSVREWLRIFENGDSFIRREALSTLLVQSRTGRNLHRSIRVKRTVLACLDDPDRQLRFAAVLALCQGHVPEAVPALTRLATTEANPRVRAIAVRALGYQRAAAAAIPRERAADHQEDGSVRRMALEALGQIGLPEDLPMLLAAVDDPEWKTRWHAAMGLEAMRRPEAIAAVEAIRRDPETPAGERPYLSGWLRRLKRRRKASGRQKPVGGGQ